MNHETNPYEPPRAAPHSNAAFPAAFRSGLQTFFATLCVMAPIAGYFVYSSYEIKPDGAVVHDTAVDLFFILSSVAASAVGGVIGFFVEYRKR